MASPRPSRWNRPLVVGWYLSWSLLWTRHAWRDPEHLITGSFQGPDLIGTLWTWWWTAFSIGQGLDTLHARWMYHPYGLFPFSQFNLVDALLATPFMLLTGPVVGYNIAVAVILALTGLAMHAVARWEGVGTGAALFAGTALITSDLVTLEMWIGRTSQAFLALLVLGLGLWRQLARGKGRRGGWPLAAATGAVSALCALEYWYYGLFLGFGAAVMLVTSVPRLDPEERLQILGKAALAGGLTVALTLPFVLVLLGPDSTLPGTMVTSGYPDAGELAGDTASLHWTMYFSTTPRWPVSSGPEHPLVGRVPWTWLIAALMPLVSYRRGRLTWLAVGALGWVLALGPYVRLEMDEWLPIPLPYLLLHDHLPFFSRLWWPYRLVSLVLPALAVLAAVNLRDIGEELGSRWRRWLPLVALALLAAELVATQRIKGVGATKVIRASPAYEVIDGPVLPVPVMGANDRSTLHFAMQLNHRQPIFYGMGGHIEGHQPAPVVRLLEDNDLLVALETLLGDPPAELSVSGGAIDELYELGLRYVVADIRTFGDDGLSAQLIAQLLDELLGPSIAEDEHTRVWRLPARTSGGVFDVEAALPEDKQPADVSDDTGDSGAEP